MKQKVNHISVAIVEDDVPARESSPAGSVTPMVSNARANTTTPKRRWPGCPGKSLRGAVRHQSARHERIECVRRLKPRLPNTQFVMVTVYEDANHIFDALSAGASGYMLKQTKRNELIDALKDVHAGGSP